MSIRIATRKSPLALWQAEHVKAKLEHLHPGLEVELLAMTTKGDKILDAPLAKVGGKGLFVKELELSLLENRADMAVHSMKDVPMEFPAGLYLPVICEREDPRDAFVSNHYNDLSELPAGAIVGTSSMRRQCQLREMRPDLEFRDLRGNVNTRLAKLDSGDYDALILAAAGLLRLGFSARLSSFISPEQCLPSAGQGALGIEIREQDNVTADLIAPLYHQRTAYCVKAERAVNKKLEGGCQVPIACFAELNKADPDLLSLKALVGSIDGTKKITAEISGLAAECERLGVAVAEELLSKGARAILDEVYADDA